MSEILSKRCVPGLLSIAILSSFGALAQRQANSFPPPTLAQTSSPDQDRTANAYSNTPQEQTGFDRDVSRHFGDAPANPGPRAGLSGSLRPADVRTALRKVANWELSRSQPYFDSIWTSSVLYAGFMAVSPALHDPRYRDAMQAMAEQFQWELRSAHPNADDQSVAQTYLELYLLTPAPEEIAPTQATLDSLLAGAEPPVPAAQAQIPWWWCDALFMAPPVYAATHDQKYLDYLNRTWWQTSDLLYDTQRHLYFRDVTYLHKTDARGNPIFWSRGEGWVMGGVARTLDYLPNDYPDRIRYETQLRQMAAIVSSLQEAKDGLWHSDMLDPEDYPQPEVSGSALITFALAWGVNHHVLNRSTYSTSSQERGEAWWAKSTLMAASGTSSKPVPSQPTICLHPATTTASAHFCLPGRQVSELPPHITLNNRKKSER